jgi:hypothetical protein
LLMSGSPGPTRGNWQHAHFSCAMPRKCASRRQGHRPWLAGRAAQPCAQAAASCAYVVLLSIGCYALGMQRPCYSAGAGGLLAHQLPPRRPARCQQRCPGPHRAPLQAAHCPCAAMAASLGTAAPGVALRVVPAALGAGRARVVAVAGLRPLYGEPQLGAVAAAALEGDGVACRAGGRQAAASGGSSCTGCRVLGAGQRMLPAPGPGRGAAAAAWRRRWACAPPQLAAPGGRSWGSSRAGTGAGARWRCCSC